MREREVAGVDLGAAVQQQRPHHVEDHEQHEPRGAEVRTEEARPAALPAWVLHQPDHREHDQPGEHRDDEQVFEEPEPRLGTDEREVEVALEQCAEALHDRRAEDDEAPEDGEVRGPGYRPLQQLALPEHLGRHGPQPGAHVGGPARFGRLPGAGQPVEHEDTPAGHHERRHRDGQTEHESCCHPEPPLSSLLRFLP